jgi:hypothetical protein
MSYLLLGYGCIVILMGFFRLAWVIVGAILFWGSLSTYECSESLKGYMWANLIINMLLAIISMITSNKRNNS